MINYSRTKNIAPEQSPEVRVNNFEEVAGGFDTMSAVREAMRCVRCRTKPCMNNGCPAKQHIPDFVQAVAEGDFEKAYEIVCIESNLPSICSRVCPHENQCEGACTRGYKGEPVAIGKIERFIVDWHEAHLKNADLLAEAVEANGHKVAIIGAGPAGIACAKDLAVKGYDITVYDSFVRPGGVLIYGIPKYRLPKELVDLEIARLEAKGVKFVTGKKVKPSEIAKDYESVFLAIGATVSQFMNIPGEDLEGVVSAQDYLKDVNMLKTYNVACDEKAFQAKTVAVVGGGNVAMDACRCAARMGAENVYVIYRRTLEEAPAAKVEIKEATEEGVQFKFLTNPVSIKGENGKVVGIECVDMELGDPDESGRRTPLVIEGSNHVIPVDLVIMAIGNKIDKGDTDNLKANNNGTVITEDDAQTSSKGVFAGGDVVTGPKTVVKAMKAGRNAAVSMDAFINGKQSETKYIKV